MIIGGESRGKYADCADQRQHDASRRPIEHARIVQLVTTDLCKRSVNPRLPSEDLHEFPPGSAVMRCEVCGGGEVGWEEENRNQ